jgi:hypothetical protein
MKKFLTILIALFVTSLSFGQGVLKGKVTSNENNAPLIGASIFVDGTTIGTITDLDGMFELKNVPTGFQKINVSYVGFVNLEVPVDVKAGVNDLGTIALSTDAYTLDNVVIVGSGLMDIAKDRETPVAVSTISAQEIVSRIGTQEFPEILNQTPSVYATKQGGGFGDSRINIRGFDQSNTAVMINGMPVNDMENGWVYWSNWAGLTDVTSAIQVQRGLGSSKLAISSVGGTVNVLTRAANMGKGGSASFTYGNDNFMKATLAYNTGLMDNGLSVSALFGHWRGDGYVDGTQGLGYNYYLAVGYKPSDAHDFQITVTGAPQQHFQRSYAESIATQIKFGEDGEPNIKYNSGWGYRDGEAETFAGNFYHKPIASLNWDWTLGEKSSLSTVAYASLGRGGSIGAIGRVNGGRDYYSQFKDEDGLIRFDDIIKWNSGGSVDDFGDNREGYSGGGDAAYQGKFIGGNNYPSPFLSDAGHIYGSENGFTQRSSMNSHNWFGIISNFNQQITDNLTFDIGIDMRTYKGIHYRRVVDFLGADGYVDNDDLNNPYNFITETYAPTVANTWNVFKSVEAEQKIDYYNDGLVNWVGVFGQLEYKTDALSAFVQASGSQQGFQRIDYFQYTPDEQATDWINILGGNVKGGANYNINENHNVFANAGYYSKQPLFDAIFLNYRNDLNDDYKNEQVLGFELGYGLRTDFIDANVNLYRTTWADRFLTASDDFDVNNTPDDDDDDVRGEAHLYGVEQVHMGVEVDFIAKILDNLSLKGMVSLNDWQYGGNVETTFFDNDQNPIIVDGVEQTHILYLDGVKVGDAAQFTAWLGLDYKIIKGLNFDLGFRYADRLYADISPESFTNEDHEGSLQLPAYYLLDGGLSYFFDINGKSGLLFRVNMNNILDQTYISESETNYHMRDGDEEWNGIATGNRVYWGFGRTWNASVSYKF